MRSSLLVIVAAGLFARAGSAAAEESIVAGIKVISEKNPDASCVETVLESIIKPGMTDQQRPRPYSITSSGISTTTTARRSQTRTA